MSAQCNRTWVLLCAALALSACSSIRPAGKAPAQQAAVQNPAAYDRALALMESGDLLAAEAAMQALTRKYSSSAGPWINLAIIYASTDRVDEVEPALMMAIELNPKSAEAYNQLGIHYRQQGRFGDSQQAYATAVDIDPDYALAYLNYGVLMDLYLQQPEEALAHYERFQELEGGDDPQIVRWIAEVKRRVVTKTAQAAQ